MGGNRSVPSSTGKVLTIFIGDVLTCTVLVALGETEVNDIDLVTGGFSGTDEEVIRFDIAMDDSFGMNLLEVVHELDGD